MRPRYRGLLDPGRDGNGLLLELLSAMHRKHEERPYTMDPPRLFSDVYARFLVLSGRLPEAFAKVTRCIADLYPAPLATIYIKACPHAVSDGLGNVFLPDVLRLSRLMDEYMSQAHIVALEHGVLHEHDEVLLDRVSDAVRHAAQASSVSLSVSNTGPSGLYHGARRL